MQDDLKQLTEQKDDAVSIIKAIDDAAGNPGGWFSIELFLIVFAFCLRYILPFLDKFIKSWFDHRQSQKTENWNDILKLYEILNGLKEEIDCDRILLMYTSNGGGIPKPGSQVFATVLHGVGGNAAKEIKSWCQKPIDAAYVSTLYALSNNRTIVLDRDELAAGELKSIYKKRKIQYSIVSNIHSDRKRYYYLTCNFKQRFLVKKPNATEIDRKKAVVEAACVKLAEILK